MGEFGDTSLGGAGGRDFPSTCWSRFLARTGPDGTTPFETLAQTYWRPIYLFIRTKWARSNEDAKDLAQDFFLWMMEGDFLQRADPGRGRFRAFVKTALDHYLSNDLRARKRLKRGGGHQFVPMGLESIDEAADLEDTKGAPPDQVLDRTWKDELLKRARDLLGEAYRREGKAVYFDVFRDYYLSETEDLDYGAVTQKYGLSGADVSNYLMHAKRRFRGILSDLVAETVESPEDLRDELTQLFGDGGS